METEASTNQLITDVVAITKPLTETCPQTPRVADVFEFLTERRKQEESRPLPTIPTFESRPPLFTESPSLPQEDLSLEQSPYVRVSQELGSISRAPIFSDDESSFFDPAASPTPIVDNPRILQRIDSRRPKASLDDRLLRNVIQADQENAHPFTAVPPRGHRRQSSYTDADKAFIISPGLTRDFGNDVVNGILPMPPNREALSAYEYQENDWSLRKS